MATEYICKCGRTVRCSSQADTTGVTPLRDCVGCPYIIDDIRWRGGLPQSHRECRASRYIYYSTTIRPGNGTYNIIVLSLDLDFLEELRLATGTIAGLMPVNEPVGRRPSDYGACGRARLSISVAKNSLGISGKRMFINCFFDALGQRRDVADGDEEIARVLNAIERGKEAARLELAASGL